MSDRWQEGLDRGLAAGAELARAAERARYDTLVNELRELAERWGAEADAIDKDPYYGSIAANRQYRLVDELLSVLPDKDLPGRDG